MSTEVPFPAGPSTVSFMAGRWRRFVQEDGWLADIIWWIQSPLDLFTSKPRDRRKIDMCDRIHVVNRDGYVGPSTASEIAYAETLGKRITYEHIST